MNKIHLLILQHLSNRQRCARTLYGIRGAEELHYLCPLSTLIVHMRAQSKHSSQSDKAAPKSFRPLAHTSFSLSSRVWVHQSSHPYPLHLLPMHQGSLNMTSPRNPWSAPVVAVPQLACQSCVPLPGKEVPTISGCENKQKLWLNEMEGSWNFRHSYKRPLDRLTHWLTHSMGVSLLGQPYEWYQGQWAGTDMSGFKARDKWHSFLSDGSAGKIHCSIVKISLIPESRCRRPPYQSLYQPR